MRSWVNRNRRTLLASAAVGVVVIATVASRLPVLGLGEVDWDEGVYWLSMRSMQAGHGLFSSVYSSQPPAFLLLAEPPWALLGGGIVAARAVMLAWCAVAVAAGGLAGWRLGGPVAAIAAAATLAVDPLMVHQSVVLQADGPSTALGLVAVALGTVAITGRSHRWRTAAAALAGAALAVGFLTKFLDVAAGPALLSALAVRGDWRRLVPAAGAGGVLAAAAILLPLHDAWGAMWSQAVGLHLESRAAQSGITVPGALALRWQLAVIALGGAAIGWRRHPRLVVTGLVWLVAAVLVMAVTHPLWPHHAVAASPAYALLVGAGVSAAFGSLRTAPPGASLAGFATLGALLCVAAGLLLWSGFVGLRPTTDFGAMAIALRAHTSPSAELLGDDQYAQALAGRLPPPPFVDTSNTRMHAEPGALRNLETVTTGVRPVCAVLFSSGRLAQLPGYAAWVAARYPVRVSLGAGRYLYVAPGCA